MVIVPRLILTEDDLKPAVEQYKKATKETRDLAIDSIVAKRSTKDGEWLLEVDLVPVAVK